MEDTSSGAARLAPVWEKLSDWRAGSNPLEQTPNEAGRVAGFGLGFWHGATAPVSFVLSLFREDVHVFEVRNDGKGYLIGFMLGLLVIWGGGAGARRRR